MSRKDFVLIAETIRRLQGAHDRQDIAEQFADALRGTNPAFDRERFIRACMG